MLHEITSLIIDRPFSISLKVRSATDAYRAAALMAVGRIKSILEPRTRLDVFASVKCDAGQSSKAGGNFTFSPPSLNFPKRERKVNISLHNANRFRSFFLKSS